MQVLSSSYRHILQGLLQAPVKLLFLKWVLNKLIFRAISQLKEIVPVAGGPSHLKKHMSLLFLRSS